jgi:transposase
MAKPLAFVICIQIIENFFCALKQFRRIATRYDKTDPSFEAMIYLAASLMALQ